MEDKIIDIASLEKFLHERIKVRGKAGALGETVTLTREKGKISHFWWVFLQEVKE